MQTTAIIVWIYGALVLAGGVMGWVKAKSKPSLVSGLIFGLWLVGCGFWAWHFGSQRGATLALMPAFALLGTMGVRFVTTKKFMPAGFVAALSLGMLVYLAAIAFGG